MKYADMTPMQQRIIHWIDTGNNSQGIVEGVMEDMPEATKDEIWDTLIKMEEDWLVICRDGCWTATMYSHDGIVHLTGADNYYEALEILREKGIWHHEHGK